MSENKSILHELYVFSEWKPEPEYIQKHDSILPENISALWRWLKFFGPKKSLIDSVASHKEKQQKWHIALGDEGKVIAVLTDNILEIRTKRSEYATIAARTTVSRDAYAQWRKLVWSPDCSFLVLAYGNGIVSFFDLTTSNLFNIPADCSKPGGLECTDNTHAVCDIIFMPLRVKDTKWNWEVLVVTFDGRLRGYVVSQTEGCKLRHTFRFPAGVAALAYCPPHDALYVAGVPRGVKDPSSPLSAGITAWRILNDDPFYKLSVVSDELEAQLANQRFNLYIPFLTSKNLKFIVRMELSGDSSKLVCVHCNGDVSVWRLPLLKLLKRWPLACQPGHDLRNPLLEEKQHKDSSLYLPADVNWWTNDEIILSRYSGAVSVCDIEDMANILSKKPEFFQGTPKVTRAYNGAFMALECESNVLPAKESSSDESMEVVKVEEDVDDSMLELTKELFKTVLFAITDMETFQPKPKKITVVSRIYRLLGVKSTTPMELFSRKIESGSYSEALSLADTFGLDSDLVYQQQWRKNPVSTDAIEKYLSKVSKKIWAVHQCVDRLPETLPAAKELLQFGLQLTNERILNEINKDRTEDVLKNPDDITLEDLNAYTSELLRCRHVMLFYKERLRLYESILKCEKSTYNKEEYDCLRSNSIEHNAMEIAKEGRINALTCLWPLIKTVPMQLAVLEKLPETIEPLDFQHLLPTPKPLQMFKHKPPVKVEPLEIERDWCRKQIFRSIWSSNWSEDITPEVERTDAVFVDYGAWYERRAREIEERSALASHALSLVTLAIVGGGVDGLEIVQFHLMTLCTLLYEINIEGYTIKELEKMSCLDTSKLFVKMSSRENFIPDLKMYVMPFLVRYEKLTKCPGVGRNGFIQLLENLSVEDLSYILMVLQYSKDFELDVNTHLELVERCLLAYDGTDQLPMACDILKLILKETDDSISSSELLRRVCLMERLVGGATLAGMRGIKVTLRELSEMRGNVRFAQQLLARFARSMPEGAKSKAEWEFLIEDILKLQSTLFDCVTKDQCYEIYVAALLSSGDTASIRLAASLLTCKRAQARDLPAMPYLRSVNLVLSASRLYFNSSSSLVDPALELAKCCLMLIEDENETIKRELDLISALDILHSFKLTTLPIQVRLCENKMQLIEQCFDLSQKAYLASHKLLHLAQLLGIAGNDETKREGMVLLLVGEYALRSTPQGCEASVAAASRLAELRYEPAAPFLFRVAKYAHAHADASVRRSLLAAAAAYAKVTSLEEVLRARMEIEIEDLEKTGVGLKTEKEVASRGPSAEEEFADAVTTPVIENKDLVAPAQKGPLHKYLLDGGQNEVNFSENNEDPSAESEYTVRVQEFYQSLYPEHSVYPGQYGYERFAVQEGRALLFWFYTQAFLRKTDAVHLDLEDDVVQNCAERVLYKDTPLSVACLLRSMQNSTEAYHMAHTRHTAVATCALLYAVLIKCNASEVGDNVYLTEPLQLALATLRGKNSTQEQMDVIRACLKKLAGDRDVRILQDFDVDVDVNRLLFSGDIDYLCEVIYRVARSSDEGRVRTACGLGRRHGLDELEVWLVHARHVRSDQRLMNTLPKNQYDAYERIKDALWSTCEGNDHAELISVLTQLQQVDERPLLCGLTAAEHIKLLKKAKAASPDLDYKLLLDEPTAEQLTEHVLSIMKPENVGMLTKFLRTLPPALKIPISINSLYTKWLIEHFFSVAPNASNKKWMQQYRQCASYFTKLTKDDLLRFIANTCFSSRALERVPPGTRNVMIMQAVDFCQQEQENEYNFNKNEQPWNHVGEELTRWARFLDNFHSSSVQAIVAASEIPQDQIWPDLEMSHGETEQVERVMGQLVMRGLKQAALTSLLHCLHVDLSPDNIFKHILQHNVTNIADIQTLVYRVCQYHKQGMKLSEELIEAMLTRSADLGLPPHKQLGLLALTRRTHNSDLHQLAHSTADLLRNEWPQLEYAQQLIDEKLLTEAGRREVFSTFMELSNTWQKKKALVDVLSCWPPTKEQGMKTIHCEYLHSLLTASAAHDESLVLIKLLLREPMLDEEEVKWLCENSPVESAVAAVWVALLNKCEQSKPLILQLLQQHKEWVQKQEIDDDLIQELLNNEMFIALVPTVLYTHIINYITRNDSSKAEPCKYTVKWATDELRRANYIAEAGQLHLMYIGVPSSLRGFTESILYFKNLLN